MVVCCLVVVAAVVSNADVDVDCVEGAAVVSGPCVVVTILAVVTSSLAAVVDSCIGSIIGRPVDLEVAALVVGIAVVVGGDVVGGTKAGRSLSAKVTLFCSERLTPRLISLQRNIRYLYFIYTLMK